MHTAPVDLLIVVDEQQLHGLGVDGIETPRQPERGQPAAADPVHRLGDEPSLVRPLVGVDHLLGLLAHLPQRHVVGIDGECPGDLRADVRRKVGQEGGDGLGVTADHEQVDPPHPHEEGQPLAGVAVVVTGPFLGLRLAGRLVAMVPGVGVTRASLVPRTLRCLELAHGEDVEPGLLSIDDADAVAPRLVEDGEQRPQPRRGVHDGPVARRARQHDSLVEPGSFAQEHGDAAATHGAVFGDALDDPLEVGPQCQPGGATDLVGVGQLPKRCQQRAHRGVQAGPLARVGRQGEVGRDHECVVDRHGPEAIDELSGRHVTRRRARDERGS